MHTDDPTPHGPAPMGMDANALTAQLRELRTDLLREMQQIG
eukprot:gene4359-15070_t